MNESFKANKPKDIYGYSAAQYTFNFLTQNVLLFVIYCLFDPNENEPDWKHFLGIVKPDKLLTNKEKEKLQLLEHEKDINKIKEYDVLFLKKFIIQFFSHVDQSYNYQKSEMNFILNWFAEKRNMFAHSAKEVVNNSFDEYETLKTNFKTYSEQLVKYSFEIRIRRSIEEEKVKTFLKELTKELNEIWPTEVLDMEPDDTNVVVMEVVNEDEDEDVFNNLTDDLDEESIPTVEENSTESSPANIAQQRDLLMENVD